MSHMDADLKRQLHRNWCRNNREKRRASNRRYYGAHKDRAQLANSNYYERNKKCILERGRQYHIENRERRLEYGRHYHPKHYSENKTRLIAQTKAYAQSHPEVRRKARLNWKINHPKRHAAHLKAMHVARKARMRRAECGCPHVNSLIRRWRQRKTFECYWCSNRFGIRSLQVDHIVPIAKGGRHEASNVCPSCPTCNLKKRDHLQQESAYRGQMVLL
jgi:5-methylcytosine-specific restriction endonuclease McrA